MKKCRKLMTVRSYDILSRHCRRPGGSPLPFILLRTLILDIILRCIKRCIFKRTDKANFATLYGFKASSTNAFLIYKCTICQVEEIPSHLPQIHGIFYISMGESNTVVSAYTVYRHLQQYCSHPAIWSFAFFIFLFIYILLWHLSKTMPL